MVNRKIGALVAIVVLATLILGGLAIVPPAAGAHSVRPLGSTTSARSPPTSVVRTPAPVPGPRRTANASGPENWYNITTNVTGYPQNLSWYASAYDPASNVVLYFGGRNATGPTGYTWVYEPQGTWVNLSGPGPAVRSLAMLAWDPSEHDMVLFGGFHNGIFFNDTWVWNGSGAGGTWTNLSISGPDGRYAAVMVTDPALNGILLYGGCVQFSCGGSDTWLFSNDVWTQLSPAGTGPAEDHFPLFAYDPIGKRVVVFGGCLYGFGCPVLSNETWQFANDTWTELAPSAQYPSGRAGGMMAFDGNSNSLVLIGGFGLGQNPIFGDTWSLTNDTWTPWAPVDSPGTVGNDTLVWIPTLSIDLLELGESVVNVYPGATWALAPALSTDASTNTPIAHENAPVQFTAGATGGVPPYQALWTPSIGPTSTGLVTNVSFATTGSTNTTLTLTDLAGDQATAWVVVTVVPPLLVTVTPSTVATDVGLSVNLAATVNDGSEPTTLSWNFGDGSSPQSAGNVSHIYQMTGTFEGNLTVTDPIGGDTVATFNVTVHGDPSVRAEAKLQSTGAGTWNYLFTALPTSGVAPYEFNWSFGDGTYSNLANASHTYSAAGSYAVRLTVTDAANGTTAANLSLGLALSSPNTTTTSSTTFGGLTVLDWGLLAAVVVLAVVLAAVLLRRPKSKPPASAAPWTETGTPPPETH
jgi:PKD domain